MELIDTHCHLTFDELEADIEAVLARSKNVGVIGWITVGTDPQQNRKAIELADKFPNMYASVGIHPHYAGDVTDKQLTEVRELVKNKKVVALGEIGLDFHYNFSKQAIQQQRFRQQLQIVADVGLPVIVHCREAFDQTLEILDEFAGKLKNVVFHCFTGSASQARILLDRGFYISFTGVVTFKNADEIRQAVKLVPLNRLMLETDCPYMSPEPMRKQKINEPALMIHTAKFLAKLKETDLASFTEAVTATTKRFFNLP